MPITLNGTTGITADGVVTATGNVSGNGVATEFRPLVQMAAQTASGTSVEFTGIPSWVRRITMSMSDMSLSTSDVISIQLGTAAGWDATGNYSYASAAVLSAGSTSALVSNVAAAFNIGFANLTNSVHGSFVLTNLSSNTWVISGTCATPTTYAGMAMTAGRKVLTQTLDRIRLVALVAGTFDSGTINVMYE